MKTLFPLILLMLSACTTRTTTETERGEALAERYCGSCHLPVSPALLDKKTWTEHVLPAMGEKLGIGVWQGTEYFEKKGATISFKDWKTIVAYYKTLAPDSLQAAKADPLQEGPALFSIRKPQWKDTTHTASTTMVAVNPFNGSIFSSGENGELSRWDSTLAPHEVMALQSPAVDISWRSADTALLTCIGNLRAIDAPQGTLWEIYSHAPAAEQVKTIGLGLPRPVQSLPADFNRDGLTDYLVCGFGHDYGGLYVLRQTTENDYQKRPVWEVPGAIHAIVNDFDGDGWPDIMALFAYGDEGIWLFQNDKKGGFKQRNLLKFPPVYGSTSFQVTDLNKDGKPDIIYTSGDNGDYSMELKPFHGVYIYLNKGDFKYEQAWFYPINGCTKAIAADFDQDGDQDIATIAFFADHKHHPAERFILFDQTGTMQFKPCVFPEITALGRWICMDAGDVDRDGDIDIVLGNYSKGFMIQEDFHPDWNINTPLILLQNKTK
ncbi:FG-GAP repeat domain-containing protein [Chitinophaga tropicalis]|uniref:VCBS repeat-containing protein n=1 Tax=Chitinophaga tropicalis TaxID=2683588 RepID=A0A7K1U633_9BACT|nr:VCBS repeat-containing protein [Chitinophaga tropicalis]MVT09746.1 VCBS repeat-containing protein [Chitinophaga tropicalis]